MCRSTGKNGEKIMTGKRKAMHGYETTIIDVKNREVEKRK